MKPHVFIPEAGAEMADAFEWYESRSPGLGVRFIDAVEETVERICESPATYPHVEGDTRRARVFGYPYSVFFEDTEMAVIVQAVFHGRRNPSVRKSRPPRGV